MPATQKRDILRHARTLTRASINALALPADLRPLHLAHAALRDARRTLLTVSATAPEVTAPRDARDARAQALRLREAIARA